MYDIQSVVNLYKIYNITINEGSRDNIFRVIYEKCLLL